MKKILLVDDHPSVREGTKTMLEQTNEFEVCSVASGIEALELIEEHEFDLYLFDLHMPTISGLELTKRVLSKNSDSIILIITGFDLEPHYNELIESGASGFLSKTASKEQLVTAVQCALRQEAVIPISLLRQLRRNDLSAILEEGAFLKDLSISEKEQNVLLEASKGKTNKEIASTLLMSQRMVEYHLTRIFGKLEVHSRGEAVDKARDLKLIPAQKLI